MTKPSVAVIGAGFSGLCAAIQVKKQLGIDAQVFEFSSDVGGTWYANTYPGAACDIPSHLYSFSFELNPDWSHHYSPQNQIYDYLRGVARKYRIYEQTRFNTEVLSIQWIEERLQWRLQYRSVRANTEEVHTEYYTYVFAGLGPLRIPNVPEQLRNFEGKTVHTAEWDASLDVTDKVVAVVGSGASAIQAIPELRKTCKRLINYQRTPAWTVPRDQFKYGRIFKFLLRYMPFLIRLYRNAIFFQHELYYFALGYHDSLFGRFAQRLVRFATAYRLKRVGRPDLIPVLMPKYQAGCKRIAKSENYLEALSRPNVTVIPSAVKETRGNIIVDKNGHEEKVDVLVLATGFNVEGFLGNLKIIGKDGVALDEKWSKEYPETYKGTSIHGFPNFFLLLAAGVGLGHNSVVVMSECQVDYSIRCMRYAINHRLSAMEPKLAAQHTYTTELKKKYKGTVWKSGCASWYLDQDGEPFGLWPSTVSQFWWNTFNPGYNNFITYK
ncbi:FAD/NAD(P)-binding domain-containing protein [Backusella circina FSU 941]|nr:FAD/NAD(P)-binding domain-containing protein [Backusella circina FSU 941]